MKMQSDRISAGEATGGADHPGPPELHFYSSAGTGSCVMRARDTSEWQVSFQKHRREVRHGGKADRCEQLQMLRTLPTWKCGLPRLPGCHPCFDSFFTGGGDGFRIKPVGVGRLLVHPDKPPVPAQGFR